MPALRTPFEPLTPGRQHTCANTNRRRHPLGDDEKAFMLAVTDEIEDRILFEGPDTVAAVFLEPVQNAGGCLVPPEGYFPRVREICDRYGVLLVSDEVICAFGRLGHMFGCERYDYLPDIITCAKGLTSGYSPLGAVICRDFLAEPFLERQGVVRARPHVRRPPGELRGRARRTSTSSNASACSSTCARTRPGSGDGSTGCATCRSSATCAAPATSGRSSWCRDQAPRSRSPPSEREQLLRGFLAPALLRGRADRRTDDRGDPVVQLAPPLVAGPEELDFIEATLRTILTEASAKFCT